MSAPAAGVAAPGGEAVATPSPQAAAATMQATGAMPTGARQDDAAQAVALAGADSGDAQPGSTQPDGTQSALATPNDAATAFAADAFHAGTGHVAADGDAGAAAHAIALASLGQPVPARAAATALPARPATTAQVVAPAPTAASPSPASAGSIGGALFALVLVVGLILALGWLARRMPGFGGTRGNPALRVVGSLALGPRDRVVVVAVGDTQLLLGVGPGGTRTLHTLDAPLPVPAQAKASPAFAQVLAQHFGKKA